MLKQIQLQQIWPTAERRGGEKDKQSGVIASVTVCPSEVTCLFMIISVEQHLDSSALCAVLTVVLSTEGYELLSGVGQSVILTG